MNSECWGARGGPAARRGEPPPTLLSPSGFCRPRTGLPVDRAQRQSRGERFPLVRRALAGESLGRARGHGSGVPLLVPSLS